MKRLSTKQEIEIVNYIFSKFNNKSWINQEDIQHFHFTIVEEVSELLETLYDNF